MAKFNFITRVSGNQLLNLNVVGAENTYLLLNDVNFKLTDLRPAWSRIEKILEHEVTETFISSGAHIEMPWAPLSSAYLKQKYRRCGVRSNKILICTGRLAGSLTESNHPGHISRKEKLLFEFGSNVPYGIYHQTGTKKMPQRKFLAITGKTLTEIAGILKKYIVTKGSPGRTYLVRGGMLF